MGLMISAIIQLVDMTKFSEYVASRSVIPKEMT